jgi:hypothetical protein
MTETDSIKLKLVFGSGLRYISDLKNLKSTPEIRQILNDLLIHHFDKKYAQVRPHINFMIFEFVGILFYSVGILLLRLMKDELFIGLPITLVGVFFFFLPIIYNCFINSKLNKIYSKAVYEVSQGTKGVHFMAENIKPGSFIQEITISTNLDRLENIDNPNHQQKEVDSNRVINIIDNKRKEIREKKQKEEEEIKRRIQQKGLVSKKNRDSEQAQLIQETDKAPNEFAQQNQGEVIEKPFPNNVNMNQFPNNDPVMYDLTVQDSNQHTNPQNNNLIKNDLYEVPMGDVADIEEKKK